MLVCGLGSGTRMVVDEIFERHGITPRVRIELGSNEAIKQAILGDLGISILSWNTVDADYRLEGLAILDVKGFPGERYEFKPFAFPLAGAQAAGSKPKRRAKSR